MLNNKDGHSDAIGASRCQELLDSFELEGPNGLHQVLVLQPMAESLERLLDRQAISDLKSVPRNAFLRATVTQLLQGFHHIHSCGLVHRGLHFTKVWTRHIWS